MKMTKLKLALAIAVAGTMFAGTAHALNQNVPIDIAFDTALSIVKDNNINFGTLAKTTSGVYKVTTGGTLSVVSGNGQIISSTNAAAGQITVSGSGTQLFTVVAAAYNANGGSTPSLLTCKIGLDIERSCTIASPVTSLVAPDTGLAVKLGVTITNDNTVDTGTAPTVDVTVLYS